MAAWRGSLGTAADRVGSAAERAAGAVANCAPNALTRVAGGAEGRGAARGAIIGALGAGLGAGVVAAAEGAALNAIGFTALGPAAGSYAAGWMSSIALSNGVGVSAASLYASAQAAAMGGGALLGAPFVIGAWATCAVVGAVAMGVRQYNQGRDGDDASAPEASTEEELRLEEDETERDQQSCELLRE